ncbi:uncharacterized protein LOC116929374 isoform X7 [Daphnia magna]|uniref:uncharacterized protein LOC116929374 isoform X7 n=1 Tax=Daphnia magna TaxID=35525 RepID=UPI0014027FFD|nr:uncharacterized protein LOC116929374 isoform X7 [Daphnia magna]
MLRHMKMISTRPVPEIPIGIKTAKIADCSCDNNFGGGQAAGSRMEPYFKQPELPNDCKFLEPLIKGYERDWNCGPTIGQDMVSRRRILSRSRDDLHLDNFPEEEDDVWHIKEKLYKDHIQEVLDKWHQIDDEIWAKLIVMERNRRVAKAYARAIPIQINGSDDGFDGFRIGLNGFDNPMRDNRTEEAKRQIGEGAKVRMDEKGNIHIKRVSKSNIYIKNTSDENGIGNDILKLPQGALEFGKGYLLFDMKKFQQNVSRELKRAYPDRRKLEMQCITAIAFAKNDMELLNCPCWVMIVNIVAMDMLKSKMPPVSKRSDIRNRPRIPIPDEDPYSVAGSGSSGSSSHNGNINNGNGSAPANSNGVVGTKRGDKPPKLPPRDNGIYGSNIPKPDYDEIDENGYKAFASTRPSKEKLLSTDKKYDDPYYCGLRARVSNFVKNKNTNEKPVKELGTEIKMKMTPHVGTYQAALSHGHPMQSHQMWHSRSFDSGMELTDSAYSRIYGRLPIPRSYVPIAAPSRASYYGEWN